MNPKHTHTHTRRKNGKEETTPRLPVVILFIQPYLGSILDSYGLKMIENDSSAKSLPRQPV